MYIYVSLAVGLIGGIGFLILQPSSTNPPGTPKDRFAEMCRISFMVGILSFLLIVGGHLTNLVPGK